uniref:Uncharacterized protein n=1 Tax=Lepeophtheirus salmonis TaxID=72036 RepID=A0A0K2UZL4_LEPSM
MCFKEVGFSCSFPLYSPWNLRLLEVQIY